MIRKTRILELMNVRTKAKKTSCARGRNDAPGSARVEGSGISLKIAQRPSCVTSVDLRSTADHRAKNMAIAAALITSAVASPRKLRSLPFVCSPITDRLLET